MLRAAPSPIAPRVPPDRLPSLIALNEHLAALAEAGVPVDTGLSPRTARNELDKISTELSRRTSGGASLREALESPSLEAPPAYRALALEWLRGADLAQVLENHRLAALSGEQRKASAKIGYFYPVLVALLAFFGIVGACFFVLPIFESLHSDMQTDPGTGVVWLSAVREWLPTWGWVVPLLILSVFVWAVSRTPRQPVRSRLARSGQTAASLIEGGLSHDEARELAKHNSKRPLPPLLGWALSEDQSQPEKLRIVSRLYDKLADRRALRTATITPLVVSVLLGGGATLLFGLALFFPVVELLWALAF